MTQQRGQGEDPHLPAARQAHEGVVLPADGGEPLLPGTFGDQAGPAGAAPWGRPWGPESQQAQAAGPMPTYEWGQPAAQQQAGSPLPPQMPAQALPPQHGPAAPLPPAAPTGYDGSHGGAYGASYGQSFDGDATQYIAPVAEPPQHQNQYQHQNQQPQQYAAAPLPPEAPVADATQYLGRAVQQPMPGALPDAVPGGPDSEATQYIPPVPAQPSQPQGMPYDIRPGAPGERQPPAEFDALFRTEPEGEAASTQQMPRFDPHAQQHTAHPQRAAHAQQAPGGRGPQVPPQQHSYEPEQPRRKPRTGSKVPLIAAIGVGLLIVGVGAGALLSGGDDDSKSDATKTVSDSSPAASDQSSPAADPAKAQAVALDKLLADSNNSREAVVGAVANIGGCKELGPASQALRDAATQRNNLVTRLNGLAVDQLPGNAELKDALTRAWKASASADSHYAAWGDQAAGKKGCHKGHAKVTGQRHAGDSSSATASTQKTKAAGLWNQIASKFGLTQRTAVQL
ncbi:hypothetical protein [Streptomyces sp. NPDC050264]|uniref:hypothetical protein n=1 Tax=Streptomyces sp. NPDC050264 TaxID=3155038 RepID=UPI003448B53B